MFTDRQPVGCSTSTSTGTGTALAPSPVRSAARRVSATAPTRPAQAAALRHLVAAQLAAWGMTDADHDAVLLVTGELLANAVQHGRSSMTLTLVLHPQLLHVSVADHGPTRHPRDIGANVAPDPDEHGRGLAIVTALAAWVEVVHEDTGRLVWAAIGLTRS
jgi:anti-sigma regulatory factor (Ser/Thr protein kinase)